MCRARRYDCEISTEKEDIKHLLLDFIIKCNLWTVIGNAMDIAICKSDVFIGLANANDFNYTISFVVHELNKHRLVSWNNKLLRPNAGLHCMLQINII